MAVTETISQSPTNVRRANSKEDFPVVEDMHINVPSGRFRNEMRESDILVNNKKFQIGLKTQNHEMGKVRRDSSLVYLTHLVRPCCNRIAPTLWPLNETE